MAKQSNVLRRKTEEAAALKRNLNTTLHGRSQMRGAAVQARNPPPRIPFTQRTLTWLTRSPLSLQLFLL